MIREIDLTVADSLASSLGTAPAFSVPASAATGLVAGEHYMSFGTSLDWTADGLASLRAAGWSGGLAELPDVQDVLAARGARPSIRSAPTAPTSRPPTPPASSAATIEAAARTLRQAVHPPAARRDPMADNLSDCRSMAEFGHRYWVRRRAREAAGLCGRTGDAGNDRAAIVSAASIAARPEAKSAGLDLASIYARRREACTDARRRGVSPQSGPTSETALPDSNDLFARRRRDVAAAVAARGR